MDFKKFVGDLGLRAKLIEEAMALERKNKPGKLRDPHWWLYVKHHWVLALDMGDGFEFRDCEGNFFEAVALAPRRCRRVFVLRSDGLFIRAYERVFSYFRRNDSFSIAEFSPREREELFKGLGRGMRQRVAA